MCQIVVQVEVEVEDLETVVLLVACLESLSCLFYVLGKNFVVG